MIIITAVGVDRPGMVHAVASELAAAGCNIEDTTMTRLSGEFAMILIVSPPKDETPETLLERLTPIGASHGLFINCKEIPDDAVEEGEDDPSRFIVTVYGPESTGLLAHITCVLSGHKVNITDVQSRVASGGKVYVMVFEVELPSGLSDETLRDSLETAAAEIDAQVSLNPLDEDVM